MAQRQDRPELGEKDGGARRSRPRHSDRLRFARVNLAGLYTIGIVKGAVIFGLLAVSVAFAVGVLDTPPLMPMSPQLGATTQRR